MTNKYQSKFKPEDYLRFLNKYNINSEYHQDPDGRYFTLYVYELGLGGAINMVDGITMEKCLDQAIIATGFEKEL